MSPFVRDRILDGTFTEEDLNAPLRLGLNGKKCGAKGAERLAAFLRAGAKVRTVYWSEQRIGFPGMRELAGALPVSQVVELYLDNNELGIDGAKLLAEGLRNNRTLRVLDVQWNLILDEGAKALAAVLPTTEIVNISMENNMLRREGVLALVQGTLRSRVERVCVVTNGTYDAEWMAMLRGARALTALLSGRPFHNRDGDYALARRILSFTTKCHQPACTTRIKGGG